MAWRSRLSGVVGHVLLEEHDPVASRRQRPDQAPPERRVAVAPGGGDGEPEHHELHAETSLRVRILAPQSPTTRVLKRGRADLEAADEVEGQAEEVGEKGLEKVGVAEPAPPPRPDAFRAACSMKPTARALRLQHGFAAGRARHGAGRVPGRPARIAPEFVEGQARPVAEADLVDLRGDLDARGRAGPRSAPPFRGRAPAGWCRRPRRFHVKRARRASGPEPGRSRPGSRPPCGRRARGRAGRAPRGGRGRRWWSRGAGRPGAAS